MVDLSVPLKSPKPDGKRFVDIVMGRRPCSPVPLAEYLIDDVHMATLMKRLGRAWSPRVDRRPENKGYLDNYIEAWYRLGYDYVRIERGLGFKTASHASHDETGKDKDRSWVAYEQPAIASWADFEQYAWPTSPDAALVDIAYVNDHLPEGMGLIGSHCANVYEHLSFIMGYENLCIQLFEAPDLVQAVVDKLGECLARFYRELVMFDRLIVVWPGDEMGFKTATLIRPEQLRQYVLPWHKRFARIAHDAGRPYFQHSCGNIFSIMEDLIEDVKIDAKHSYENAILPVEEFQSKYGQRIGVLGGVDVDVLTAKPEDVIRKHVRKIIDTCAPRGRYAVGSGNSIPSYVPFEHYLAMLDEAMKS